MWVGSAASGKVADFQLRSGVQPWLYFSFELNSLKFSLLCDFGSSIVRLFTVDFAEVHPPIICVSSW